MSAQKIYYYVVIILLTIPLLSATFKFQQQSGSLDDVLPKNVYQVSYEFDMFNLPEEAFVKAYLPQSNGRQIIRPFTNQQDSSQFSTIPTAGGTVGKWEFKNQPDAVFKYDFEVEAKSIAYTLPEPMLYEDHYADSLSTYLMASEYIQVNHDSIAAMAKKLRRYNVYFSLKSNFDFVSQITNSGTSALTDAVTTLRRKRGSCNGKSRLFVALCRAQGIPARVVGGIILGTEEKRTSHLWAEIFYQGHWIPFDVLNQHFAELPANYLEVYTGDHFLITHTKDIGFDYQFKVQKKYQTATVHASNRTHLWSLVTSAGIPMGLLRGILLLPLAALIIAIFKNVVGLKTFGIFLPALIALALVKTHLGLGLMAFATVILVVSLLHLPLEKLGLLHTPKLVIMMTCVVLTLIGISIIGLKNNWITLTSAMFLPVIVLSITAERFAKTLVEENLNDAFKMLSSTFFIAFLCYPIFNADLLIGIFLTYPEFYFSILGVMILLGRWIGFRVLEYKRFASLLS